jgi:hypothetical protein
MDRYHVRSAPRVSEIALLGDFAYYSKAAPGDANNSLFIQEKKRRSQ